MNVWERVEEPDDPIHDTFPNFFTTRHFLVRARQISTVAISNAIAMFLVQLDMGEVLAFFHWASLYSPAYPENSYIHLFFENLAKRPEGFLLVFNKIQEFLMGEDKVMIVFLKNYETYIENGGSEERVFYYNYAGCTFVEQIFLHCPKAGKEFIKQLESNESHRHLLPQIFFHLLRKFFVLDKENQEKLIGLVRARVLDHLSITKPPLEYRLRCLSDPWDYYRELEPKDRMRFRMNLYFAIRNPFIRQEKKFLIDHLTTIFLKLLERIAGERKEADVKAAVVLHEKNVVDLRDFLDDTTLLHHFFQKLFVPSRESDKKLLMNAPFHPLLRPFILLFLARITHPIPPFIELLAKNDSHLFFFFDCFKNTKIKLPLAWIQKILCKINRDQLLAFLDKALIDSWYLNIYKEAIRERYYHLFTRFEKLFHGRPHLEPLRRLLIQMRIDAEATSRSTVG